MEVITVTKSDRELREHESLFTDERYAKRAWKQLMGRALDSPSANLPNFEDKQGNVSPQSLIYKEAQRQVQERLDAEGLSRPPTKAELIVEANIIRAAFDTGVFNIILDRTAGKVREEITVGVGSFEELTDEELELLAKNREAKRLAAGNKE